MQLSKEGTTFISREAVLKEMETWVCRSEGERKMLEITKEWLRGYPAADVRVNVHGEWIENNPHTQGLGSVFKCSECAHEIDAEVANFCPNCGALMSESLKWVEAGKALVKGFQDGLSRGADMRGEP